MSISKETENYAVMLAALRKELERAEIERLSAGVTGQRRAELEKESLLLRKRERELLLLIGKEVAAAIEGSSGALKALAARIKVATNRMGRVTGLIDKSEKKIKKAAKGAALIPKK